MNEIALVTDSTAYLLPEEIARYGITVIPLTVNFDDGSIVDELVDAKEFFDRIDRSKKIPFTSQPAQSAFVEVYRKLIAEGKEIVSIHVSSRLSGTFNSATGAAAMVDSGKITLIDSESATAPLAFLVLQGARWAKEGIDRATIATRLKQGVKELGSFFIPDTFEYMKKGGRIGGAQALLGSLLQIKPVLHFSGGVVEVFEKVRTKRRAVNRMLAELPRGKKHLWVAVVHCAAPEEAARIQELVKAAAPQARVEIREIGPVINIHGGPGLVGMGFWAHDYDEGFPKEGLI